MSFAIRVEDEYVGLMGRHVVEGQAIVPGARLVDIMTPEGIVETIVSQGWGIVAHVEGSRIFPKNAIVEERADDDDEEEDDDGEGAQGRSSSGGMASVFSKGDVICHIVARSQAGAAQKSGLHPRSSNSVRMRFEQGLAPR